MKKILVLILCLFCLSACSDKNEKTYDVYVNDKGYNLEDKLVIGVNLETTDYDINVCPIIKISKEGESDVNKIVESIGFSTDNIEFLNLYAHEFNEKYNDGYWTFESVLSNDGEDIDISKGDVVQKINIIVKEKGNYKISLAENKEAEQCDKIYGDSLTLNITNN